MKARVIILYYTGIFYLLLCEYECQCCQIAFEAEYGFTNGEVTFRSAASNGKTVRFTDEGQYLLWYFKTPSSSIDIHNVVYSNDGSSDNLTVFLDQEYLGEFQTLNHRKQGAYWNVMLESGLIGTTKALSTGNHTLNVSVSSVDFHGVEIDHVTTGIMCDDVEGDKCCELLKVYGIPNNDFDNSSKHKVVIIEVFSIIGALMALIAAILGVVAIVLKRLCRRNQLYNPL